MLFDTVIIATEPVFAHKIMDETNRHNDEKEKETEKEKEEDSVSELMYHLERLSTNSVKTRVIIHTDSNLMPKNKKLWSSVNIINRVGDDRNNNNNNNNNNNIDGFVYGPTCTIWMNQVSYSCYNCRNSNIFTTWNPNPNYANEFENEAFFPKKESILCDRIFYRSYVTCQTVTSKNWINKWQNDCINNKYSSIYFVGTYLGDGLPLLDNCVQSAKNTVNCIVW